MLYALAAALPHHAKALAALADRLFDLLRVVRNYCYHPDYRGSFSIKNVAPGPGYDDLAIADGNLAAARYQRALASTDQSTNANKPSPTSAPTANATPWPPWNSTRR